MSEDDKVTETLALLADTLRELSGAVEHISYRLTALEDELAESCYLEDCDEPAGVHGLCDDHMPKAVLQ